MHASTNEKHFTFWIERGTSIKLMTADDIGPFIIISPASHQSQAPATHWDLRPATRSRSLESRGLFETSRTIYTVLGVHWSTSRYQGSHWSKAVPSPSGDKGINAVMEHGTLWHPAFGKCLFWTHIVIIWLLVIDSTEKVSKWFDSKLV